MDKALSAITGMASFTFDPCAGAHGELTGLMIMRQYHSLNGDLKRTKAVSYTHLLGKAIGKEFIIPTEAQWEYAQGILGGKGFTSVAE